MFNQIYADTVEFEEVSHSDLINLIFVDFISKKIQELRRAEKDESKADPWVEYQNVLEMMTEEDRWFNFAARAVETINREHVWNGICEAFKFLKNCGPTNSHKTYFDKLFSVTWVELMLMYTETKRPPFYQHLFDYADCSCKLKYRSTM